MPAKQKNNKRAKNSSSANEEFSKACDLLAKNQFVEGKDILLGLAKQYPDTLNIQLKLIESHINLGEYSRAKLVLEKITKLYPNDRAVLRVTPLVLFCLNRYTDAYHSTLLLSEQERSDNQIQNIIRHSISFANIDGYSQVVEKDILGLVDKNEITETDFYNLTQMLLNFKLGLSDQAFKVQLEDLASDPLFLKYLAFSYVRSPVFEQLLTLVRGKLLTVSLAKMELPDNLLALAQGLAHQSFHNEYVFGVSEEEQQMLSELELMLERLVDTEGWSPFDAEGLFLLLCMYQQLHCLPFKDRLLAVEADEWPESIRDIVTISLYEIEEEIRLADEIETVADISDEVSNKVRTQYEASPYPRWSQLYRPKAKCTYPTFMLRNIYGCPVIPDRESACELLVAGCGTGYHPLSMASSVAANITAIDLSKRSLAYATRAANKFGVSGVKFLQLDLLELDKLETQYDVVESIGVIHHMRKPEDGLRSLLNVLKPSGYLRLGLYSSIARAKLIKLRELYVKSGMEPSEENIRAIRQAMLNSSTAQDAFGIVNEFADFYTMSAYRDLIFHEEEHCFTLSEIKALLLKYDLKFIGFSGLKNSAVGAFVQLYGADHLNNLDAWAEFEGNNPSTFDCMYQFFCQKTDVTS